MNSTKEHYHLNSSSKTSCSNQYRELDIISIQYHPASDAVSETTGFYRFQNVTLDGLIKNAKQHTLIYFLVEEQDKNTKEVCAGFSVQSLYQ